MTQLVRLLSIPGQICLMTSLVVAIAGGKAHADFILRHWENRYEPYQQFMLAPEFTYFSSSQNYNASGSSFTPAGLSGYSRMHFDLLASYGLLRSLSLFAKLNWSR